MSAAVARNDRSAARYLVDRVGVAEGLLSAGADLAALLRDLPAGAGERPVPGTDWTIGETAAHVVTVVRRSLGDARRSESPRHTHDLNAICLGEFAERDPARLADLIESELAVVVGTVMPRFPDDDLAIPFHGGSITRLLTAYGIMLFDLVVHRRDVALAVGHHVELQPAASRLALQAILELLPLWADPSSTAEVDLVLDVQDDAGYHVRLSGGVLAVRPAAPADDARPRRAARAEDVLLVLCGRVASPDPVLARLADGILPI